MRYLWPAPVLLLAACGASMDFAAGPPSTSTFTGDGDDDDSTATTTGEEEEDLLRLPPAQTDVYVFVANPERDTVTRVEVRSLAVDTTPVGQDPRLVVTTADRQTAVVFNRGDASVSILDADTLAQEVVEIRDNLNDLVLSPDGAWAVAWHNTARVRPDDPPVEGLQSFNEASFVRLADASHQPLAVGFDPQMVRFTPDGALAVVVSDSALALVDLTQADLSAELIELQPGVLTRAKAEEVVVAPDGSYAWVRLLGSSDLRVVDLSDKTVTAVPSGAEPSDLDLSPDGRSTVSVSRGTGELFVFTTERPFDAPRVVALPLDATYGSLQFEPSGGAAVLFTNAVAQERYALWDTASDVILERPLVKPVQSVGVSPDGGTLLVFHTREDGPLTNPLFAGKDALTLIDLDDFRTNPMLLPAPPLAYANAGSGALGYLVMEGENYLEVLDYDTLLHEQIELPSPPVFLGVLPDLLPTDGDEPPAWVSQEYSLGRLTFWDPDERVADTLTGFELNAGIEVQP
jgi:DNA-binding beta-propeller fold protein YncE